MYNSTHKAKLNLWKRIWRSAFAALKAPPVMSVADWADKYRHLAMSAGATGGPWRTSRVEVARGPMMAVTEPGVQVITLMVATQTLKTSLLENVIGYFVHLDPSPMLLVQPKDESVGAFSKERLTPMVKSTPVLKELMGDERTRKSADTIRLKQFPGGLLAMVSAGSPSNLAMRAIRIALEDEIDKYETTKEGDPVLLAEERLATFPTNRLAIRACSPTWEETSRIFKSYESSDKRRPYIACPHCAHEQTLDFFRHVHWEKDSEGEHMPRTAVIKCEACKEVISEAQRQKIIGTKKKIRWYQTRPFSCCGEKQNPMETRSWSWDKKNQIGYAMCVHCGERGLSNHHAGFTASKLYSPFISTVELAEKWLLSKDDPEAKQTFYNTQLGQPFRVDALKEVESHALKTREEDEDWSETLPEGTAILTGGLDVQTGSGGSGRIECEIVAWGLHEESWSVAYKVFEGDPAKPELWKEVDEYLSGSFKLANGNRLAIAAACIDSGGHNTQDVYRFASARSRRNIWAIKGAADKGGQWSPVWPAPVQDAKKLKKTRIGFRPVIVGVSAAKESIRQRLLINEHGPGFCHFPSGRPNAYYDQLTSERLVLEKKAGHTVKKWLAQKGRANEALDCRVYAYAALHGLYIVRKMRLERQYELVQALPAITIDDLDDAPAPASRAPEPPPRTVRRSNFLR